MSDEKLLDRTATARKDRPGSAPTDPDPGLGAAPGPETEAEIDPDRDQIGAEEARQAEVVLDTRLKRRLFGGGVALALLAIVAFAVFYG